MQIGNEELKFLKELQKIYAEPRERERHHKKVSFLCRLLGVILFVAAFSFNYYAILKSIECLIIAFIAGASVAAGYFFTACSKEVSVLAKYTNINEELVCNTINELGRKSP